MGGANGIRDEFDPDRRWARLGGAERTVRGRTARYYITNLPVTVRAAQVAELVRGHWGIQNSLHWVLDDTFQEDRCPPAHRPCRPQHGRPAVHRLELPDASQAVFLAKDVNSPVAQDGGPQPCPIGDHHGPVTTLSTPYPDAVLAAMSAAVVVQVAAERVDVRIDHWPDQCDGCGAVLPWPDAVPVARRIPERQTQDDACWWVTNAAADPVAWQARDDDRTTDLDQGNRIMNWGDGDGV